MDSEKFQALVDPHRVALERFVAMMGEDAEDIVQETLAVALREVDSFQGRSKLSTWLFGIALNLCRNRLREKRRHARSAGESVLDAQPARSRGVLSSVIRHEIADRLEVAVASLPATLREAFLLRFVEGMDYPEIAAILGTTEGTARVRAFRARGLLRSELGAVVDTVWLEEPPAAAD